MQETKHHHPTFRFNKYHKMRNHNNLPLSIFTLIIFLLLNHLSTTNAEIRDIQINDDFREIIIFDIFTFTNKGRANINVSSVSLRPESENEKPINYSQVGFFVTPKPYVGEAYHHYRLANGTNCVFTTRPFAKPIFTFHDLSPTSQSITKQIAISIPDTYVIYLINCNPESHISMNLHLETYNLNGDSNKNYLDNSYDQLPTILLISSLIYFVFLIWWLCIYFERKSSSHKIHILMAVLLTIKSLESLCLAENKYHVKITGQAHGWDIVWYGLHFIRTLLLFVVIVLIGAGWSFLRPVLHEEGKKMLALGIPLQVFSNVMYIAIWESGYVNEEYHVYAVAFFVFDLLGCMLIFAPLLSSIESLKENAKIDGKAAVNLSRLKRFRNFYIILIVYVTATRFGMLALRMKAIRHGDYWWITFLLEQVFNLLFYAAMFYTFRPTQKEGYVVPSEYDEEAARAEIQKSYLLYLM